MAWLLILEEIAFVKSTAADVRKRLGDETVRAWSDTCHGFAFTESQPSSAVYYSGGQSSGKHCRQAMLE